MCGESYGRRGVRGFSGRHSAGFFGMDVDRMSAGSTVMVALAVLVPVSLSGVVLTLTPVWWIFTTYFWVALPALGLLGRGIAGLSEARPARATEETRERELLGVLDRSGEVSAAGAAAETSMTVAEADRQLGRLAEGGHLEVRVRGGAILYALWEMPEGDGARGMMNEAGSKPLEPGVDGARRDPERSGT